MATNGTLFKYFALIMLTALLAGTLALGITLQTGSSVAGDPNFYKSELDKSGAYDLVYAKLNAAISEQGGPQATAFLTFSGVQVTDIVTRRWIKNEAETLIDHALTYAKGQSASANLTVELTEPKANLFAAAQAKLDQIPPNSPMATAASTLYANYKDQFNQKVPDQINLSTQADVSKALDSGRSVWTQSQNALLALLTLAVMLAALVAFLARQSLNSILRWLGAGLLLAGALAFGLLSFAQSKTNDILSAYSATPEGTVMIHVAQDGIAAVQSTAFPLATALIVVGIIGIAAPFFNKPAQIAKSKSEPKSTPVSEGGKRK